jgi:hypothetical protein
VQEVPEFAGGVQAEVTCPGEARTQADAGDPASHADIDSALAAPPRVLGEPERPSLPISLRGLSLSDAVIEERHGFPMPWREPAPDPKAWRKAKPLSTRENDPPEFVARVEAEARGRMGGTIEELVSDPALREITYNAIAGALRQCPRPVAPEIAALATRLARRGVILTPGSGDVRDLPKPITIRGVTLSGAVIEERYGYE